MLLQTVAVILTVVILDVYFTPAETPVPGWLKSLNRCFHATFSCRICRANSKSTSVVTPEPEIEYSDAFSKSGNNRSESLDTVSLTSLPGYEDTTQEKSNERCQGIVTDRSRATNGSWVSPTDSRDISEPSWKEIATMFDKICLYLYLLTVVLVTVTCMGIMWYHFVADYE